MSSKNLEIKVFLTPAACFTIACLAFSVVALSTTWRNWRDSTADTSKEQQIQRVERVPTDATDHRTPQGKLKDLIVLDRQIILQLRALGGCGADLIVELYSLMEQLRRFCGDNRLLEILTSTAYLGAFLDTAIESIQAIFASLQTSIQVSSQDSVLTVKQDLALEGVLRQVQSQRHVLEVLLKDLQAQDRSLAQGAIRAHERLPSVRANDAGDMTPAVESGRSSLVHLNLKAWEEPLEPPPEYSSLAGDAPVTPAEKPDAKILEPAVDSDTASSDSLYEIVTENNVKALEDMLARGADCSARFGDLRRTALHQAAHLNHTVCLSLLLQSGADASIEDAKGDTGMHLAAWAGNVESLAVLLDFGADVDWISGRDGNSPLWAAISAHHSDAARLLLKHGARVSLRSVSGGLTPLHQAAVTGQGSVCELLMARGARPNCIDDDMSTPLHFAAASGSLSSVRALLRGGANIDVCQIHGLTPLHWAAHKGHIEVVSLLLDHDGNLSCKTEGGATPLHLAASRGHSAVVRVLLARDASKTGSANWDRIEGTPAEMANIKGHVQVARMLQG